MEFMRYILIEGIMRTREEALRFGLSIPMLPSSIERYHPCLHFYKTEEWSSTFMLECIAVPASYSTGVGLQLVPDLLPGHIVDVAVK